MKHKKHDEMAKACLRCHITQCNQDGDCDCECHLWDKLSDEIEGK